MNRNRTIVLVGTGAYVTHDAHGPGVVARSLAQWCALHREEGPWTLRVIHRSDAGAERFRSEWKRILSDEPAAPDLELISTRAADTSTITGDPFHGAFAAFVCVPDEAHAEWVERSVARGVPTWIVKPLTGEGRASRFLDEAATRSGVPLWVDYHKRFDVSNRMIRSAVRSGEYGAPRLYSVRYSQPRDLPLDGFAWAGATDVFTYIGCHYVDQLFYVMPNLVIDSVSARGISGPVHQRHGGRAFDTVLARLDGQVRGEPVTAQFEVGWSNPLASPTKSLQVVEVAFDRGRLFMDQMRRGVEVWSDEASQVPNPWFFSRVDDPVRGRASWLGYGWESIRHFLDFCAGGPTQKASWLANDALPWASAAVRVDEVLDRVRAALDASLA